MNMAFTANVFFSILPLVPNDLAISLANEPCRRILRRTRYEESPNPVPAPC